MNKIEQKLFKLMKNNSHILNVINKLQTGEGSAMSVYFIGIGGIGMSALARYFNSRGVEVSGYDKTATQLTMQLQAEGIAIHYEDNIDLINKDAALVIYTPAVSLDHKEYNFFLENGYTIFLTADHGNADYMINEDGSPNTAHTLNLVPFFIIDKDWKDPSG